MHSVRCSALYRLAISAPFPRLDMPVNYILIINVNLIPERAQAEATDGHRAFKGDTDVVCVYRTGENGYILSFNYTRSKTGNAPTGDSGGFFPALATAGRVAVAVVAVVGINAARPVGAMEI